MLRSATALAFAGAAAAFSPMMSMGMGRREVGADAALRGGRAHARRFPILFPSHPMPQVRGPVPREALRVHSRLAREAQEEAARPVVGHRLVLVLHGLDGKAHAWQRCCPAC
jgi:hypothetical protein